MPTFLRAALAVLAFAVPRASFGQVDLTLTSVAGVPASAGVGRTFSISTTVKTTGAVKRRFVIDIYLSVDGLITSSDTLVASRSVSSLSANGTSTAASTATVPMALAPGAYFVGAIADGASAITEADESNNSRVGPAIQIVGADLTMPQLATASARVTPGGTFTVTSTVAAASTGGNAGNFSIGFYLSADAVITPSDLNLGTRAVSGLTAGSTSSGNTNLAAPAWMAPGAYYLGARADYLNEAQEPNEENNAVVGPSLRVTGPNLAVTTVTGRTILAGSPACASSSVTR